MRENKIWKALIICSFILGIVLSWVIFSAIYNKSNVHPIIIPSPSKHIDMKDVMIRGGILTISNHDLSYSQVIGTGSMKPTVSEASIMIYEKPNINKLKAGDIIYYKNSIGNNINANFILHRIIEIGTDGEWYALTKGDANKVADKNKIRFSQINFVVAGILY